MEEVRSTKDGPDWKRGSLDDPRMKLQETMIECTSILNGNVSCNNLLILDRLDLLLQGADITLDLVDGQDNLLQSLLLQRRVGRVLFGKHFVLSREVLHLTVRLHQL